MDKNDPKVIELINKIAKEHSGPKKEFGYFNGDDLFNEIWVICLEKLSHFDAKRGDLERFLRTTVHNRMINKKKDVLKIVKSPCPKCKYYKPGIPGDCKKFGEDHYKCDKWNKCESSRESRNALLNPVEQKFDRPSSENIGNFIVGKEIKNYIESNLNEKLLYDFKEYMNGSPISFHKKEKLFKAIKELVHKFDKQSNKELIRIRINGK